MAVWSVYILRCADGSLYTGISTDVARRVREHAAGQARAARYTRAFEARELVYEVGLDGRSLATRVEHRIKALTKAQKEFIVKRHLSRDELLRFVGLAP